MGSMFPEEFLWGAATAGYQVEGDICNRQAPGQLHHRACTAGAKGTACGGQRHRLPALVDRGQLRVGVSVRTLGPIRPVPGQPHLSRNPRWELPATHDRRGARHAGGDRCV